jgi:signal transduction histidine kinase/CheY-like chemotaxis protein
MGSRRRLHFGAKLAAAFVVLAIISAACCLLYILLPSQTYEGLLSLAKEGGFSKTTNTFVQNPVLLLLLAFALYMIRRIYQAYEKAWFSKTFHDIANFLQELALPPQTPNYCEEIHSLRLKLFPEVELHGVPVKLYGRDTELSWLKHQLSILSNSSKKARAVLLWGEQGIGKTQLAYCFATDLMKKRRYFRRWQAWYVEGVFDAGSILESLPNAPVILIWDDVSLSDTNNSQNLRILLSNRGRTKPIFVIATGWQGRFQDSLLAFDRIVSAEIQIGPIADSDAIKIYPNAMLIPGDQRGHPLLLRLLANQGATGDADFGTDPLWSACRRWAKSFEKRLDATYGLSLEAKRALAVVSCSGRCPWEKAIHYFELKEADKNALLRTGRLRDRSGEFWLEPLRPDLLGWAFCLAILNNAPTNLLKKWRLVAAELSPLTVPRFIAFSFQKKHEKAPWVKMLRSLIDNAEANLYLNIVNSLENVERFSAEKRFDEMEREALGIYDSAQNCKTLNDAYILAADAAARAVEAYLSAGMEDLAMPHLEFIYKLTATSHVGIDIARAFTRAEAAKIAFFSTRASFHTYSKEHGTTRVNSNNINSHEAADRVEEFCGLRSMLMLMYFGLRRTALILRARLKKTHKILSLMASNSLVALGSTQQQSRSSHYLIRALYVIAIVTSAISATALYYFLNHNLALFAGISFFLLLTSLICAKYVRDTSLILFSLELKLSVAEDLRAADFGRLSNRIEILERKTHQAVVDAEAAALAKGELLATMSHEIRTPLTGMVPILDLLSRHRLSTGDAELVHTAYLSAQQMLRITDDILDYSKLEASKLQLESTTFNLLETLESVIHVMERPAQDKGLRLTLQIDPSSRLQVCGDLVRLRQVLTNLISNAVKFTERGSVSLSVRKIGETTAQHQLRFEVRDTGIGISLAAQEHLFQAFSQANASTRRLYGGTGLGVAISKRIIDLMGGRIGVESDAGQGALFWFEVPMVKVQGGIIAHKPVENTSGRVLLLTSDHRLRLRLNMLLPNWGLRITTVETTQEALERLRSAANQGGEWAYTVVIADLASIRSTAVALQRNLKRQNTYGQVLFIGLLGDEPAPEELLMSVTLLQRHSPDADLRAALLGTINTAPQPSVGKFTLETPLAESPAESADGRVVSPVAVATETAPTAEPEPARPMRVLLVEDNPVNLMVMQRLLSVLGTHCDSATNGEAALLRMSASRYDVVLMDCQMPVMDGYTATRRWREHEAATGARRLPIVAMTVILMAGDRQKCFDAGADDYLAKPVTRGELERCLFQWRQVSSQQPAETSTAAFAPAPAYFSNAISAPAQVAKARIASHQSEPSPLVLDQSVLDELRGILGNDLDRLISVFLDDTPRLIAALEGAVPGPDYEMLRNAAHTLKCSSSNLGAVSLANAAKRVESGALNQNIERPAVAVALIANEFSRCRQALKLYMDTPESTPRLLF